MAAGTAVIAAWCVFKSGGDFGEFFGRFIVLFALLVLLVLFTLWEKRSRDRAYEKAWQSICHVLDGAHSHEGIVLRGTWKGRPFEAMANAYMPGPNTGMVLDYRLAMPADQGGPPWKAERAATLSRGSHLWTVRSDAWGAGERLTEAGLLDAIEEAEQRAVHFRRDIRLAFDRRRARWPMKTTAASHRARPTWSSTSTSSGERLTSTSRRWPRETAITR